MINGTGGRDTSGAHFQLYRTSETSPTSWRLLGGNHRPLGRSARFYESVPACRDAVSRLVSLLPELELNVARAPGNLWSWRLSIDGTDLAVSAHLYDRQIRALHAREHFRRAAATARMNPTVVVVTARRSRSLARTNTGADQ